MSNLFKFEFRKLFRSASFYVCLGICLVMMTIMLCTTNIATLSIAESLGYTLEVKDNTGWANAMSYSEIGIVFPIFAVIYFLTDNGDGTIKNIIGRGITRTQFYFVKLIILLLASSIYFFASALVGYIVDVAFFNVWTIVDATILSTCINVILYSYFYIIVTVSFIAFSCSFIKKAGWAMIFAILVPSLFNSILGIVDALITLEFEVESNISSIFYVYYESFISSGNFDDINVAQMFFVLLSYLAVFTTCGWLISTKEEI